MIPLRPPAGVPGDGFLKPSAGINVISAFGSYLSDESRLQGMADRVVFPCNEAEIAATLREAARQNQPVTVSAGRTGVVGGAVPMGGWLLSVERLQAVTGFRFDEPTGEYRLRIQPGIPLSRLQRAIRSVHFPFARPPDEETQRQLEAFRGASTEWLFPPDPTETTAQIGGMTAGNASGARTFFYGPTRAHVRALTVVLPSGEVLEAVRGQQVVRRGDAFRLQHPDGSTRTLPAPTYRIPIGKHAAGYHSADNVDLIDLFIGSEGTLGVISEIEIALCHRPGIEAEVIALFPDAGRACQFVDRMRRESRETPFAVESLEYLCDRSLAMLNRPDRAGGDDLPRLAVDAGTVAVFIGLRVPRDLPWALGVVDRLIGESGGFCDRSLAAFSPVDLHRILHLRHALPETVNARISRLKETHPTLTKLGTDMAVPDEHLAEIMALYSARLNENGLDHVVFGHIGNNHLHVNILPRDPREYDLGKSLYIEFAETVVRLGGSVSAEHGIGKLKKYLFRTQFGPTELAEMKAIKTALDPHWLLGVGTLFDP